MFGSSSRLFLFNTPLSLLHNRPSSTLLRHRHLLPLSAVLLPPSRATSHFPIKSSQQFHSQYTSNTLKENNHVSGDADLVPSSHPWPEWSELLESISRSGYFDQNRNMKDEFVPNESLSMGFVDAACSCLGFAQDRPDILGWLSKDDIKVLIDDGAPFLFKNVLETERRMRSFLQGDESNDATTVDLMKYILSYASNPIIYPERNIREATESSARNLLREMTNLSSRGVALTENFNGVGEEDEQTPRNPESNSKMKRGDWICPKCRFMNLAKNTKCLECEELRPRRQLTGAEWDCPQCNFFNYGRNTVCLKCECTRPGEFPLPTGQAKTSPARHSRYENSFNNGNPSTPTGQDARKDARIPVPNGSTSGYAPFVPLPADTFAKKSQNTKTNDNKETVTRSYDPKSENFATKVEDRSKEEEKSEKWFEKVAELHDVTDLTQAISDEDFPEIMPVRKGENRFVVSKKKDRLSTSQGYERKRAMEQGSNTKFVPFVPFPPDYFAKKDEKQQSKNTNETNVAQKTRDQDTGIVNSRSSLDTLGSSSTETRDQDTGIVNSTRDQDMGIVNSRSSLDTLGSSSPETRDQDMGIMNSTRDQDTGIMNSRSSLNTLGSSSPETRDQDMGIVNSRSSLDILGSSSPETRDQDTGIVNSRSSLDTLGSSSPETRDQGASSTGIANSRSPLGASIDTKMVDPSSTQVTRRSALTETTSFSGGLRSETEKKSLEGSAVKETDPLDMSEEAKAERWFRRVAQIKDISELSQIPDEDFPSIMPMRKGVNRFVVSKRKTPLERRLTSPPTQYRKNLQDQTKREGDGS